MAHPLFRSYGALSRFSGPAYTVKVFNDNSLVRQSLEQSGDGRGPGGGRRRFHRVCPGGRSVGPAGHFQRMGRYRGPWPDSGDSAAIGAMPIGIKAINTNPRKSVKKGAGEQDLTVTFGGVTIAPGGVIYSDEDGILVATRALL